ncbi:MAG: 4-alpha-glucanotransferase [Dehalococcoidia bacterium]
MAGKASTLHRDLYRLAQFRGVQTSYRDAFGRYQHVNVDALLAVLRGLKVDIERIEDAPRHLQEAQLERWDFNLEPVVVAWDSAATTVPLRVPEDAAGALSCSLRLENGSETRWKTRLEEIEAAGGLELEGVRYVARSIPVPKLEAGYHRLRVEFGKRRWECFVISAPKRAYEPPSRYWGFFAPLYALHSERSWGTGDVTDLLSFADWVAAQDGDFVATLPLLPAYLEPDHLSPSPYSPVSRLFWNELYADPARAAQASGNAEALSWLNSPGTQQRLAELRSTPAIDYEGTWGLKRQMLGMLAADDGSDIDTSIAEYARFRAVREKQKKPWREWPERLRQGEISADDYDEETFRFYATSQRIIGEQLMALSADLQARGQQTYLDLPIGCDADGFDTWKYQSLFALSMQCGAPPDILFTQGQAWGLPPMIPAEMRRSGYEYLRATISHHLSFADILRYDHVIGLHRLYWVPDGFSARQGIFVQYPAEELYAILSIESHRAKSAIVGENLGTVPQHINASMARHGIFETYVMQYEIPLDASRRVRQPPRRAFAGMNTHDMPTFAGFLEGKDLKIQETIGIRDHEGVLAALEERRQQVERLCAELETRGLLQPGDREPEHIFQAALTMLRGGRAKYLVINVEDLWLEEEGHNVPGTATGNWQRRLAPAIDALPDLHD